MLEQKVIKNLTEKKEITDKKFLGPIMRTYEILNGALSVCDENQIYENFSFT